MFLRKIALTVSALALTLSATVAAVSLEQRPAEAWHWWNSGPQTTTVEYGPFTIPAAEEGMDGHGAHEGGVQLNVEKPCEDCFITGFDPTMTYADGTEAHVNTGPMLHHFVMFNSRKDDAVCNGPQRVMASGNERVASDFPEGYGLRVDRTDRWMLNYDLMNQAHEAKTVYISVTFTHESALGSDIEPLTPLWLDIGGCYGSTYDAPEGTSEESRTWTSTVSGEVVHSRGHLHHSGHSLWTENLSTGEMICHITAEEGGSPEFIDMHGHGQISDMPPCNGDLGRIDRGDQIRTTSRYVVPGHAHDDVMGIMVAWVAED